MSNFFEQELRKLFGNGEIVRNPQFVGRVCLGELGGGLRARAEFVTTGTANQYEALRLTVWNRTGGEVDRLTLRIGEVIGHKEVPALSDGTSPHIWTNNGKAKWFAYQPTNTDYQALRQAAGSYFDAFRERMPERPQGGPKLVYICAPLRGEVEKNIEFARQKAQEVFQAGDIPVCPHLMFPPIADPENPVQDQAAREMGLRLVESCQQVNVYGPEWTAGMWAEIRHAMDLGIEVKTDQKTIGRGQPHRQAARKGTGER